VEGEKLIRVTFSLCAGRGKILGKGERKRTAVRSGSRGGEGGELKTIPPLSIKSTRRRRGRGCSSSANGKEMRSIHLLKKEAEGEIPREKRSYRIAVISTGGGV